MDIDGGHMVKYIKQKPAHKDKCAPHMLMVTKENKMKQPNLNTEFGWSVFKGMLMLLIFTNLLWAGICSYTLHKASADIITSAEMMQDGSNNNQSITNG